MDVPAYPVKHVWQLTPMRDKLAHCYIPLQKMPFWKYKSVLYASYVDWWAENLKLNYARTSEQNIRKTTVVSKKFGSTNPCLPTKKNIWYQTTAI